MKQCSRCGTEILTGQLVCPRCGKPQRQPRRIRCRHCGTLSGGSLEVCPACGEPLRHDWLRPMLRAAILVLGLVLVGITGSWLWVTLNRFQPAEAMSTVQAVASEVPVLVEVPTLTPSLTPSITPTPTSTPTSTPTPSRTPSPTLTPTPTDTPTPTPTDTPTPTATRARPTATPTIPTDTPTPAPTAEPPALLAPEDEASFGGEKAVIKLAWTSSHTLEPDECYLVTLRWTENGAPDGTEVCVQQASWFVPAELFLRPDQETGRAYHWSVRLAQKKEDSDGNEVFVSFSPPSEERTFYWQ